MDTMPRRRTRRSAHGRTRRSAQGSTRSFLRHPLRRLRARERELAAHPHRTRTRAIAALALAAIALLGWMVVLSDTLHGSAQFAWLSLDSLELLLLSGSAITLAFHNNFARYLLIALGVVVLGDAVTDLLTSWLFGTRRDSVFNALSLWPIEIPTALVCLVAGIKHDAFFGRHRRASRRHLR